MQKLMHDVYSQYQARCVLRYMHALYSVSAASLYVYTTTHLYM